MKSNVISICRSLILLALALSTSLTAHAQNLSCLAVFEAKPMVAAARSSVPKLLKLIDQTAAALKKENLLTSPIEWRKRTAVYGLPGLDLPIELGGMGLSASQEAELGFWITQDFEVGAAERLA